VNRSGHHFQLPMRKKAPAAASSHGRLCNARIALAPLRALISRIGVDARLDSCEFRLRALHSLSCVTNGGGELLAVDHRKASQIDVAQRRQPLADRSFEAVRIAAGRPLLRYPPERL